MDIKKFLSKFYKGTKNQTLDAVVYFMAKYNNPEKSLKIIHIAGTNGKGSCVEMISNVLICARYRVGKFISPHLIKYNERICVDNKEITDAELEELIKELMSEIEIYNKEHNNNVTLFELELIMALIYFNRKNCDFVVLETGLGGLHDSTNIVNPIVSVITSIGYDHMHILGNTLPEIAKQKAGIIKENSTTVFISQDDDVNEVIKNTCKAKNNTLHLITEQDISNYSYNEDYQKFDYKNYKNILVNLKGKKQIYNASICLECMQILKYKGYDISEDSIRKGLSTVIHRARFEQLNENPIVIYDGAHNKPAMQNLINSVNMYYKNNKKIFIVSILKTKDYKSMLGELLQYEEAIYIFTSGNNIERYVSGEILANTAKEIIKEKSIYNENVSDTISGAKDYNNIRIMDLKNALDYVIRDCKDYTIFIVGSFYVYGDVIDMLKEYKNTYIMAITKYINKGKWN